MCASGNDGLGSGEAQKVEIQEWAEGRGLRMYEWYVDEGSSGVGMNRPGLHRLLDAVQSPHRDFDVVVLWALHRLSRNKQELDALGVLMEASGVMLLSVRDPEGTVQDVRRLGRLFRRVGEGRQGEG